MFRSFRAGLPGWRCLVGARLLTSSQLNLQTLDFAATAAAAAAAAVDFHPESHLRWAITKTAFNVIKHAKKYSIILETPPHRSASNRRTANPVPKRTKIRVKKSTFLRVTIYAFSSCDFRVFFFPLSVLRFLICHFQSCWKSMTGSN